MNLNSNVVDPYVGQQAEGKVIPFESPDKIDTGLLKVFLFDSPDQKIITETKEFQAVCPFSGLPDVGRMRITYYPTGGKCVELKALKYYLISFKNVGLYQEGVTKRVYDDLCKLLETKCLDIETEYNVRGGFETICTEGNADRDKYNWDLDNDRFKISVDYGKDDSTTIVTTIPATRKKERCKDDLCTYSRSINQPYPRACLKCGHIETV